MLSAIMIAALSTNLLPQKTAQADTAIHLSNRSVAIESGHTKTLKIYGTKRYVYWCSNNTKIATVNKNGKVTAKSSGTTKIIAVVAGKRLTCTVKVLKISKKALTLSAYDTPGHSKTLTISGPYRKVTWSSGNKKIATVSSKGKVTAVKTGIATITAKVDGKLLTCKVTVVAISNKSIVMEVGGWWGYITDLHLLHAPGKITWTTSNKKIATVSSSGTVRAKGAGSAVITASVDGIKITCKVKVLKINAKKFTLHVGKSKKLSIYGTTSKITWSSNYKAAATVSSNGTVTAVSPGTATIFGEVDGRTVEADVTVIK